MYLNCSFNVYTVLIRLFLVFFSFFLYRVPLYYLLCRCLNFPMWVISWIFYPREPPSITCFLQLGVMNLVHEYIKSRVDYIRLYLSRAWKPSSAYLVGKVLFYMHDIHIRLYSASLYPQQCSGEDECGLYKKDFVFTLSGCSGIVNPSLWVG